MAEQRKNIGKRYFWSVVVDAIIHFLPFIPLGLMASSNSLSVGWTHLFAYPLVALYLTSDRLFCGASVGKRIFKLRLESCDHDGRPTLYEIMTRRLIEPLVLLCIFFPKANLDIDRKTNTVIVPSFPDSASLSSAACPSQPVQKSMIPLRIKAWIIDLLCIFPVTLIRILLDTPEIQAILDFDSTLNTLISVLLINVMFLHLFAKDLLFGNQSYGKHRAGIEIVMSSGKRPSVRTILIRSIILNWFWPIECILMFFSKRLIAERFTDTAIRLVVNPRHPLSKKRKVVKP